MARNKIVISRDSTQIVEVTAEEEIAWAAEKATWDSGAIVRAAEEVQRSRRAAYQVEADHLHLEEARGEVEAGTWVAKIAEIKARYPKP
jgi:hypothetical protein